MNLKRVKPGIYLVLNPAIEKTLLLEKLKQALDGGLSMLQIWNNWPEGFDISDKQDLIRTVAETASSHEVPVLVNEEWKLLKLPYLDGVHFDRIPGNIDEIRTEVNRKFIIGVTCENNLDVVRWAEENDADYLSFCSMFPSPSAGSCEIVNPETVQKARQITGKPIFLSGGITPDNLGNLKKLDFDGIAVISGILNAVHPAKAVREYDQLLKEI